MRRRSRRRRVLLGVAAFALAIGGAYLYATRPARLRAGLVRTLQRSGLADVQVGEVWFSVRQGLQATDLALTVTPTPGAPQPTDDSHRAPLLQVGQARIRCSLTALLLGRFRPTQIILDGASLTLIRDADSGATNWESGRISAVGSDPGATAGYPRLTMEHVDVRLLRVENGQRRLVRRLVVDVAGTRAAAGPSSHGAAYVLRATRTGDASAAPVAELRLYPDGHWAMELDWLDLETAALVLPRTLARTCRELNLTGRIRVERLEGEPTGLSAARLELAGLNLSVPVEDAATPLTPEERFLQITDAAASIRYGVETGGARLEASGRIAGAPARLTLSATGIDAATLRPMFADSEGQPTSGGTIPFRRYQAELHVDEFTLPTAQGQSAFVRSSRLPGPVRNFLKKYDPQGRVNVRLTLRGRHEQDDVSAPDRTRRRWHTELEGELETLGATCRYVEFPYLVQDVHGRLRFTGGSVHLDNLHGRHGTARIRADGRIYTTKSWSGFDLTFSGRNVGLNGDLYAALPPHYARLWRRAAPVGLCDTRVTIHRDEGSAQTGPLSADTRVEARLLGGSLSVSDDCRLDHADGLISIERGVVTLHDLHGHWDDALLCLAGTVAANGEHTPPRADVRLEGCNIPLERVNVIRDTHNEPLGTVAFRGVGDIWGRINGNGTASGAETHYTVRLRDGVLSTFDPSRPWSQVEGWIALDRRQQRIVSLSARRDDARLEATGTLPAHMTLSSPVTLDLRAEAQRIQDLLQQVVPARWARVREALGLTGKGKLSMRLEPQAADGAEPRLAADIRLQAEHMRPEPLPLDLSAIDAHVTLRSDGLELHEAAADYGDNGRIHISGRAGWETDAAWSDLRVTADGLEFCDNLIEAMPGPFAELLRKMGPKGSLHAALDRVRLTATADRSWQIIGRLVFQHAELQLGLPLTDFDGELAGTCLVLPDGDVELRADFVIDRGRLAGREIARWEGLLTRAAGEALLRLEDVRGRLCDGEVVGRGRIDPVGGTYELSLTLRDLSLPEFVGKRGAADQTRSGRIDGRIFVRGRADDHATRRGGGELRIRGASLFGTPVLASVAEATRQANRAVSDAAERIELRFVWDGHVLRFARVDIRSRDLRLVGEGSWDMRDDGLAMTLVGVHPDHWPRVAVLSELIEVAGQELLQYRVTGTAAAPRVKVEPLHNLTAPLRRLVRENE